MLASIAASATCATQNDVRVLKHLCHPVLREFVPCPEAGGMADAVIEVYTSRPHFLTPCVRLH